MKTSKPIVTATHFLFLWIVLLTMYRILSNTQDHMGLFYDEAYYFHWSEQLDWGYYSKPPMVAWLISASTFLFGISELSVKIFSPLLYAATAWLVYVLAKLCLNKRAAIYATLIFSSTPLVGFNSLFITTDAPLFFFWALSSYLFLRALKTDSWRHWLFLGFSIGLGILSKYTFVALPLGLLCYALIQRQWFLFQSLKVWSAVGIALILACLNLYWNWAHDFIAFSHTKEIAKLDGALLKPWELLSFLGTQILIFGFVWSMALIACSASVYRGLKENSNLVFLLCTALPILVIIGSQAFLSRAFANWAGPFIIPTSILAAYVIQKHLSPAKVLTIGICINLIPLSLTYHWPLILDNLNIEQSKKNSPYQRFSGWRELSEKINPILTLHSDAKLLSQSRELLAYVGFYSKTPTKDIWYWNPKHDKHIDNHYDLKSNIGKVHHLNTSNSYVFVSKKPLQRSIQDRFKNVEFLGKEEYKVSEKLKREVYVYHMEGFQGYRYYPQLSEK